MRRRDESGQAVTAIAIVATLVVLAAALMISTRIAKGSSEVSKIQSGADAAALAGAQDVVNGAPGKIRASLVSKNNEFRCGDGQARAAEFAGRNSTSLTSYCYVPMADRVEAQVVSRFVTETGRPERARAVAELDKRLGACIIVTLPSTTGYYTTATCGDITVDVYVDSAGDPHLITPEPAIKAMFTVTLKD